MTAVSPRRATRTPGRQLLGATAIIVVASLLGRFIGLAAALLATTIYAWEHKDVHMGIAVGLTVVTVILLAMTVTGLATGGGHAGSKAGPVTRVTTER